MSRISNAIGCSKATLYLYFSNKHELFTEFMMSAIRQCAATAFELPEPADDINARLRMIGYRYIAMFSDATVMALYRSVIHERQRFPEIGRYFVETGLQPAHQKLSRYLEEAAKAGVLPITDVKRATKQFFALCLGRLIEDLLLDTEMPSKPPDIEHQVAVALDAFFAIYPRRVAQIQAE